MDDAGEDTAGVEEIAYGAKRCERCCFRWCGRIQVRPGRRDERTRTVRQEKNQVQRAVAPHPAKHRECLAFQRVARSDDGDCRRLALEVGSVMPFRSTTSITSGYGSFSVTESTMEGCSGSLTNG